MMNKLKICNKSVNSIFRLIGNDENALTFSLGYIFSIRSDFLIVFLKEIGILPKIRGQNYKKLFSDYLVHLQQYNQNKSGIMDIVIEDQERQRLKIIIEAKIDESLPSVKQLTKYAHGKINSDLKQFNQKWIVGLSRKMAPSSVAAKTKSLFNRMGINLLFITWSDVIKTVYYFNARIKDLYYDRIIDELHRFIIMNYKLNYFEYEVIYIKVGLSSGYYSNICNSSGYGYYFNASRDQYIFPSCLYFLACYGPQRNAPKTGDYLRRIISYDILSAKEILNSKDRQMINAL